MWTPKSPHIKLSVKEYKRCLAWSLSVFGGVCNDPKPTRRASHGKSQRRKKSTNCKLLRPLPSASTATCHKAKVRLQLLLTTCVVPWFIEEKPAFWGFGGGVGRSDADGEERSSWLTTCGSISIYLSIYLSLYLSIYPSIYLSIHPSINLSIYLSVCLTIYLSIYLYLFFSFYFYLYLYLFTHMYLSMYAYISLSLSLSIFLSI